MFNFALIDAELFARHEKLKISRKKPKKSKFGSAGYFRQFKKIKVKGFTRKEPPKLKQSNPFEGEPCEYPQNYKIDSKLNRTVNF